MSAPLEGFYFSTNLDISLKGRADNVNFQEGAADNVKNVLSRNAKIILQVESL